MKQLLVAVCAVFFSCTVALAAAKNFVVQNNTGAEIVKLYISPSLLDDWGDNVLPGKSLKDHGETKIPFAGSKEVELWDLKTIDKQGTSTEWPGLSLAEVDRVLLSFEDGEPVVSYE